MDIHHPSNVLPPTFPPKVQAIIDQLPADNQPLKDAYVMRLQLERVRDYVAVLERQSGKVEPPRGKGDEEGAIYKIWVLIEREDKDGNHTELDGPGASLARKNTYEEAWAYALDVKHVSDVPKYEDRPRVLVHISGGVCQGEHVEAGVGTPDVQIMDWDNLRDGDCDPDAFDFPEWAINALDRSERDEFDALEKAACGEEADEDPAETVYAVFYFNNLERDAFRGSEFEALQHANDLNIEAAKQGGKPWYCVKPLPLENASDGAPGDQADGKAKGDTGNPV